jgi:DHA1 family bicyclomycin/chloramphenicol resistance-like MFS transporter
MNALLIVILAALSMLGALSIDAYLPAFPAIALQFSATNPAVQQSLTAYVFAFAIMTLFYGTLSDSFGRRPIVIASLVMYLLSSVGAAFANSLEMLIVFRFVQGLSAGGGAVIGRAIITDLASGAEAHRAMSYVSMVFGLAPAIAPILGGFLLAHLGWRSIFIFIALFSLTLLVACLIWLRESLAVEKRQPFQMKSILATYWMVGSNRRFLFRAISAALSFSGIMIYVAAAPEFVLNVLHFKVTEFAWLFIPLIGGMTLGSYATARMSRTMRGETIIRISLGIVLVSAISSVLYSLFLPPVVPWILFPLFTYAFGAAAASAPMMVIMLEMFPDVRGLAASLQTFFFMGLFTLESGLIVPFLYGSALKFALAALIGSVVGVVFWALSASPRPRTA